MKLVDVLLVTGMFLLLGGVGSPEDMDGAAFAEEPTTPTAPDNTGVNKRDRNAAEPTADNQKNNKSDVELTAKIRRSLTKEKALSSNARNVKIIAQEGRVTLKGPVRTEQEKSTVERKAAEFAGQGNVTSELEINPDR